MTLEKGIEVLDTKIRTVENEINNKHREKQDLLDRESELEFKIQNLKIDLLDLKLAQEFLNKVRHDETREKYSNE